MHSPLTGTAKGIWFFFQYDDVASKTMKLISNIANLHHQIKNGLLVLDDRFCRFTAL